jgi:hypothetical protein
LIANETNKTLAAFFASVTFVLAITDISAAEET